VDTRISFNHKPSVTALILISVFVGLLVFTSGCTGTTEAASDLQKDQGENVYALAGDSLAPAAQPVAQESTVLHFDPAPAQVTVGSVVAVQLRLENVENLYGIEVHLTFDKDVVQIEDDDPNRDGVQITSGEIPHPDFTVQNMVDNFGGRLDYAVVQLAPRAAASGSGVVATIHFRGVRPGSSAIHFTKAKLASPDGFAIPVTLQDGSINVTETTGPTPTLAPSATPGPTATSPPPLTPSPTDTPTPTATAGCPTLYVVRSGDTVYSIARRFGVSLQALATANSLPASFAIKIGQLLVIPGVPGPTGTTHVVQAGETLYSIARLHGSSVETLAALNRLPHPWHVRLGQTLLICPP
jgi:LysM repeat protein